MLEDDPSNYVTCPACGRRMQVITAAHYRKHGYEQASSFKEAFGLHSLVCLSKRQAHSQAMKDDNPMAGVSHSKEALKKMRKNRRGKGKGVAGKYARTPEIRTKISEGVVRAMCEGRHARGEWFFCEKADGYLWTRSSWERRVLRVLDLHPCVEEVEGEPFAIPYEFEGSVHLYVPDLLVHLEGDIRELWEIKPAELMEGDSTSARKNRAKREALNEYVLHEGMNGRWVPLEQILGMEMQVGLRRWVGPGVPWVDHDNRAARPVPGIHYGEKG